MGLTITDCYFWIGFFFGFTDVKPIKILLGCLKLFSLCRDDLYRGTYVSMAILPSETKQEKL